MPTPSAILDTAAAFLNDQAQSIYTDADMLPHFNQALRDLQEEYELNDIPVTYETSSVLNIVAAAAGTEVVISYSSSPALPAALIEIKKVWESPEGLNLWTPLGRRDFLPQYTQTAQISQFLIWAWVDDEIHMWAANQDNDIKIDYVKSLFSTIAIGDINTDLGTKFNKCYSYLAYRTASLSARYIGENPTRANELTVDADKAMSKALGIGVKGKQAIATRRLPFRFGYRRYGRM